MTNHISVTSGYTQVLTSQHCPEIEDLIQSAKHVQDTLNSAYVAIVKKYDDEIYHLIEQGKKQGHFRDAITQMVGKYMSPGNSRALKVVTGECSPLTSTSSTHHISRENKSPASSKAVNTPKCALLCEMNCPPTGSIQKT